MKTLKSSLKFSVVEITPKDAEVLLSKYLHNRPISRDNINKYAIQMSEGKWHLNGEAIIINDKGLTDNGYHRLAACIQAGDVFGIMGITNPTQKASIVAKYYALTKGLKGLADAGALHRLRGTIC